MNFEQVLFRPKFAKTRFDVPLNLPRANHVNVAAHGCVLDFAVAPVGIERGSLLHPYARRVLKVYILDCSSTDINRRASRVGNGQAKYRANIAIVNNRISH
jgi:hypothetical protein